MIARAGRLLFAVVAAQGAAAPTVTAAELAAQACFTLLSDDETKGGGAGLAVEAGVPVLHNAFLSGLLLTVRLRASALIGAGLAWSGELGGAFRVQAGKRWAPEAGLWVLYLGGDLVRAIDDHGRLARNPLAVQLALNPVRFQVGSGWVSFLAVRYGRTLFRPGRPPFAFSATFVEIGRRW